MRKLLLWLGTMWVGTITVAVVMSTMIGAASSGGAMFGGLLLWLFALIGGLLLSAPAFLKPPDSGGGLWEFRLPWQLWAVLIMMKMISWLGFYILLGTWMLIFKVWDDRQGSGVPVFSNGAPGNGPLAFARQQGGASGTTPPAPASNQPWTPPVSATPPAPASNQPWTPPVSATPPASWQTDPTGRYRHRWWDGTTWTDRVANGSVQSTDPLHPGRVS